ncbi:MarR family transcriptional regulator [Bengtsoniella intestinalis]|uniref:MarR family winged helix-turn-helix transcriptional regulator n=1 Tax=Bengtsoniella intestinalis TaxID=3073143 RepID=UPI00391F5394
MHDKHIDDIPMGALLGRNAHLSRAIIEAHLEIYDMTLSQTHMLMKLHESGGQAVQSRLTEHLHVKPSTVNGLVERMEERGLVTRATDPNDGRQRLITLTQRGRTVHHELKAGLDAGEARLAACFTPEEHKTLRDLLIRMARHLEQERDLC